MAVVGPVVENIPGLSKRPGPVEFMENSINQMKEAGVKIFEILRISDVQTDITPFRLTCGDQTSTKVLFTADAIILATGISRRQLDVPGARELSGRGVSDNAVCDGALYKDKRVAVIGGGNSAILDALYLADVPCEVFLIYRSSSLKADKKYQDRLKVHPNIKLLDETLVSHVHGTVPEGVQAIDLFHAKTGRMSKLEVRGVFVAIGTVLNNSLAKKIGLPLTEQGFIVVDQAQRVNIPRIYAAGDITSGSGHILVAMGEGVRAAMSAYHDLLEAQII
jgi:thioredoxin reductase (NADPH)